MASFEDKILAITNWFNNSFISLSQIEECFKIMRSKPPDHFSYYHCLFLKEIIPKTNLKTLKKLQKSDKDNWLGLCIDLRMAISPYYNSVFEFSSIFRSVSEYPPDLNAIIQENVVFDKTLHDQNLESNKNSEIDREFEDVKETLDNLKDLYDHYINTLETRPNSMPKIRIKKTKSILLEHSPDVKIITLGPISISFNDLKEFCFQPNFLKATGRIKDDVKNVLIITESSIAPLPESIISLFEIGQYPCYYGSITEIIQNVPLRLTVIDLPTNILKQYINAYHKQSKLLKDQKKEQRICQAEKLFKSLLNDLIIYRENGIEFHCNIFPHNILIYENENFSSGARFKLVLPRLVDEYKISNGCMNFTRNIPTNEHRYMAPELVYREYYIKKFGNDYRAIDYHKADIWAIASCTLHMITDKMIDKWNRLDANNMLTLEVVKELKETKVNEELKLHEEIKESKVIKKLEGKEEQKLFEEQKNVLNGLKNHDKLKNALLSCFRLNYHERANINDLLNMLR